ncbi:MAG TPA: ABC transporter substrate-binding protein [Stellaceae bacterium]|nr:ABC transporter substrate-binding protein [Stellaceae bacterium]
MQVQVEQGHIWQTPLAAPGTLVFYPPGLTVRTVQSAARFVQVVWDTDLYPALVPELRAAASGFEFLYPLQDPLLGQIVTRLAQETDGGFAAQSFEVLGSLSDKDRVIVSSRIQIHGAAPIRIDWQLNPTNHGYKVTDLIVNGISMASTQHSDVVSVVQRNDGQVPALLVALREKNSGNGIVR